jgi:peptide chain release factor 2
MLKNKRWKTAKRISAGAVRFRSYVLDDARIKDLRTGVESRNTQAVLDGALDPFIQASLKQGL